MSKMLREVLVPQMNLWRLLAGRVVPGAILEDNQSTITVANSGYSPQLRHLHKHHRISLGLVHDFIQHEYISLECIETANQKGDLMTKGLSGQKHQSAMDLIKLMGGTARA